MANQNKIKNQDEPVYLDQLDDGTRPPAQAKSTPASAQQKPGKTKSTRGSSQGNSFVISVLLFIFVLLAGVAALLLTGKIALPL